MSQIKDLANDIENELDGQFSIVSTIGRSIEMECNGIKELGNYCDDELKSWKIKIGQKKCEVWNNHLIGLVKKDPKELSKFIINHCKKKAEKNVETDTNKELNDYLVSALPTEFLVLNKSSMPKFASFTIDGPNSQYLIRATYKNAIVEIYLEHPDNDLEKIQTFNLSNPEIEKSIANYLVKFDKQQGGKHVYQH